MKTILGFDYKQFIDGLIRWFIVGLALTFILIFIENLPLTLLLLFIELLSPLGVAHLKLKKKKSDSDNELAGALVGLYCSFIVFMMYAVLIGGFRQA